MQNKSEKHLYAQQIINFFSFMPVSKEVNHCGT